MEKKNRIFKHGILMWVHHPEDIEEPSYLEPHTCQRKYPQRTRFPFEAFARIPTAAYSTPWNYRSVPASWTFSRARKFRVPDKKKSIPASSACFKGFQRNGGIRKRKIRDSASLRQIFFRSVKPLTVFS